MTDDRPIYWNCPNPCGVRFRIGAETTIVGFNRQPWLSYIRVLCPQCHNAFTRFLSPDMILRAVLTRDPQDPCEVSFEDYAPDFVVEEFARQYNVPAITEAYQPPDTRSDRRKAHDEHEVEFLHWLLDHGQGEEELE